MINSNPARYSGAEIHRGLCIDNHKHLRELEYVLAFDYDRMLALGETYEHDYKRLLETGTKMKAEIEQLRMELENERHAMKNVQECAESYRVERDQLRAALDKINSCAAPNFVPAAEYERLRAALDKMNDPKLTVSIARALANKALAETIPVLCGCIAKGTGCWGKEGAAYGEVRCERHPEWYK